MKIRVNGNTIELRKSPKFAGDYIGRIAGHELRVWQALGGLVCTLQQ